MSREMKNSGVQWIGDIPKDWDIDTIGNLYTLRNEKVSDKDYPPLSVSKMGVVPQLETAAKTDDGDNRKLVKVGDFAINSRSDRRGSCGISAYDGSVSLINTVITPREQMNPRFYSWLFRSELFADEFYKWGHGIVDDLWTTRWQEMKRIGIVAPSLEEQQKIASFLDKKCSEIDEMIALQEKIVEELKAYKQSVITEAVTKGLNPDVPMKDSGVEWIGEIPEHSSVSRIGFCVSGYKAGPFGSALITGNLLTEGKILVYTPEHIAKLTTEIPNNLYLQEERLNEMSQFLVKEGEVIFPIVGSLGRAMRVNSNMPVGIINQRLSKFTIKEDMVNVDYFMWLFGKSSFYETYIEMYQRGSFIVNLTKTLVYDMPIVLHPINEQKAIADYLDKRCTEIDNLISIKLSKIDSLNEYKKSIIYEYVTGKKEVNG